MTEFQAWFQPLLWVIATITAIVAFIRLCKPVWKIFTAPAEFSKQLSIFSNEMHDKFADMNERMDRQDEDLRILREKEKKMSDIQLSMLHDQIRVIYHQAENDGFISTSNFERVKQLYAQDGQDPTIDHFVDVLTEMHKKEALE